MGAGLSQTHEEMAEQIKNGLDINLESEIKKLTESSSCDPKYISYAMYLLKSKAEQEKRQVELFNQGKNIRGEKFEK
jgi:hypothetical protein